MARTFSKIPAMMAAAAAFGLTGVAAFAADGPSATEELAQLKARIEQLEAKQAAEQTKATTDKTVADVLADADRRSQMLQAGGGLTAGYNNGFFIQSEDKNFVLRPMVQFQARYVANFRDEGQPDGDDDAQNGLEVRRLKLNFEGNVFGPNTKYKFQWATSRTTGGLTLEEAFVTHMFDDKFMGGALNGFGVKVGQFKDMTFHEELLSSKRQLAVERSLMNEYIAGGLTDYEQGALILWESKNIPLRVEAGYLDGANTDNTNFTDSGGPAAAGITNATYGLVGRVEYMISGNNWKAYDDFSAMKNTGDLLVVGAGVNWTGGDGGDVVFHTVDVQWEPKAVPGLGVYAAFVGLYGDYRDSGDAYHWGILAQAGYMLNETWEVFGRYDLTHLDDGGTGSLATAAAVEDTIHEITVGFNYYMKGHNSKVTVDFSYLPNGSPQAQDGAGVLNSGDSTQFLFRAQYQLLL